MPLESGSDAFDKLAVFVRPRTGGRPVVEIRTTIRIEIRQNNRDCIDCGRPMFPLETDARDKLLVCKID